MFRNPDAKTQQDILTSAKVIAVVGHSSDPSHTSYQIAQTLREGGYRVYPVNPTTALIDGQRAYASLAEVPEPIDIVSVFRRSEHLAGVVAEAIQVGAKAVWAQVGVYDEQAAERAAAAGIPIIMDRCIRVAYFQLVSKS